MNLLLTKVLPLLVFLLVNLLLLSSPVIAQESGTGTVKDRIGEIKEEDLGGIPTDINDIIGKLIQLVYAAAGVIFFFMFILGGIRYITAGGDEKAATSARGTLTQAVIGLIIVVAAFLITQLLFSLFGIDGFIKLG